MPPSKSLFVVSIQPVLTLPDDAGIQGVWAPEMHAYNGAFYLFATLTYDQLLPEKKPVEAEDWPAMHVRGTHIFRADTPLGPFGPLKSGCISLKYLTMVKRLRSRKKSK